MDKTYLAKEEIETEESAAKGVENPECVSVSDINCVVSDIRRKLNRLGPSLSDECCIYMVPKKLRKVNEAAYTPQVVSIGPIHHGQMILEKMEKNKLRYLDKFLARAERSLEYFVSTIRTWESRIRSCYAEIFDHLSSNKFVMMILEDAGFIIWLFLRKHNRQFKDQNDCILHKPWLNFDIQQDLILLENQLPFFVLQDLYDLAFPSRSNDFPSFLKLTCCYFSHSQHNESIEQEVENFKKVKHFTDLLRSLHLPRNQNHKSLKKIGIILDLVRAWIPTKQATQTHNGSDYGPIPDAQNDEEIDHLDSRCELHEAVRQDEIQHLYSASELHEAGVKFVKNESKSLFDIKSENGELKLPRLNLDYNTECFFRNLMALEQCHFPNKTYICNYVTIMDYLIDTAKDVDLLVQEKIIVNRLGDRVAVATLFNSLCTHIVLPNDKRYTELCRELNKYHDVPINMWNAILYREYFSTPWRIASTTAAIILLVLTLIQTICSVISLKL